MIDDDDGDDVPPAAFPEPGAKPAAEGASGQPATTMTPAHQAVLEQKQFVTGRISETVRYVGFGLLAIFYAMISSDAPFAHALVATMSAHLLWMAICGALAVFFDYLQYLAGSIAVDRALTEGAAHDYNYNRNWLSYRARGLFFWIKQIAVIAGCLLLLIILVRATFPPHAPAAPPAKATARG